MRRVLGIAAVSAALGNFREGEGRYFSTVYLDRVTNEQFAFTKGKSAEDAATILRQKQARGNTFVDVEETFY